MTNRCTFKQGLFNCGSYAFNLYKENIEQGDYCDQHYWEDRAMKAEALVDTARADEREQIAAWYEAEGQMIFPIAIPKIIRARGTR